ncbi:ABC transporter substrate-binding protein [Pelagibacterium halotolerans]|uniref:ABC transporter substrate-binding protein n=1 Tax=Pelagibacterium halotolerans TaxID=531813 RepID=UPI00384A5446
MSGSNHSSVISRRKLLQRGGAAVLASGLYAPAIARAANSTIKIGYVGSLSGVRAAFGETENWTIEKMREHLSGGLVLNGKTYNVELVVRDNQSDANRSASVASELVMRERCNLVLAQDGEAAAAIGELADARGVPTISSMVPWQGWMFPRGGTPDKGFPYTFHFFAGSDAVMQSFVGMFDALETNKKVGTTYLDNPAGQGLAHPALGLPAALSQAGYEEVGAGMFQLATNDFSRAVSAFAGAECDIVSGFMYPNHFIPFWNQVAQAGYTPKACAMAAAFLFPSAVSALGDRGDGMATEVWWTPNFPFASSLTGQGAADLAGQWEEETGKQWTQPLGYGHALWEVGLAALAKADDPTNNDSIRDAIAALNVDTVIGPVNFASSPVKSVAITPIVGGQWRRSSGQYDYDLRVVNNANMPAIPLDDEMVALTSL